VALSFERAPGEVRSAQDSNLKELQKRIHYTFEETPNGGRIIIATADKTAVDAVHRFLRFQIQEHHTGDPQQ